MKILEQCYVQTMQSLGFSEVKDVYGEDRGHCFVDKLSYQIGRKHLLLQNF